MLTLPPRAWGGLLACVFSVGACLAAQPPQRAFFETTQDPDEHPEMPDIVAHGSAPADGAGPPRLPCALCHLPNGAGHVESASLAGLAPDYIVRQLADMRSGARQINVGDARASRFLTALKASYTDAEVRAAADYYAVLAPRAWIRVRETRTVPRSFIDPATLMRLRTAGGGDEPLGSRIVELAGRDAHSGYIAYVPVGAVAKGESLALGVGGKTIACARCHGRSLTGFGDAPPLAGRPPTYLLRQLWNFQGGLRRGDPAAAMQAVVARLGTGDMLALAAYAASLPPTAPSANRDALRRIVQDQCAVHWSQQHSPSPCERIYLPEAREGFAVLADRKGGAHFLLIPTRTVAGMESAELLEPGAPNYFADAWSARDLLARSVGHDVPRDAVGLALNPRHARSQDQLHIHIECLRADVALALRREAPRVAGDWSPIPIDGRQYQALRVMGEELGGSDPPGLLAHGLPAARSDLGDYTMVVAGMVFTEGPGFILLAGRGAAGELLLDSTCAIAATP